MGFIDDDQIEHGWLVEFQQTTLFCTALLITN